MKPTFWRSASFRFDGGPNQRYSSRSFSDTESEEDFVGFTARHARPYVEITIKAPLFCSTSTLKANRTRVERENHSSTSSKDGPDNSTVKYITPIQELLRILKWKAINVNRSSLTTMLRFFKPLKIETRAQAA